MKILNGAELAGFVKQRQSLVVAEMLDNGKSPKLAIVRDSDNPVIAKYVELKKQYGKDIGVVVMDVETEPYKVKETIKNYSDDQSVDGIILQLPIMDKDATDEAVKLIAPEKDVDGLSGVGSFDSATATAINWLLTGYDISLAGRKIALVGHGRLVGMPLQKMWQNSGYDVTVFQHGDDLSSLINYDVIVTATGVPHLIKSSMVKAGAVVVDAGTASEGGVLIGDIEEDVRDREDLLAVTPRIGGVGPLTVAVLFENVITAATKR